MATSVDVREGQYVDDHGHHQYHDKAESSTPPPATRKPLTKAQKEIEVTISDAVINTSAFLMGVCLIVLCIFGPSAGSSQGGDLETFVKAGFMLLLLAISLLGISILLAIKTKIHAVLRSQHMEGRLPPMVYDDVNIFCLLSFALGLASLFLALLMFSKIWLDSFDDGYFISAATLIAATMFIGLLLLWWIIFDLSTVVQTSFLSGKGRSYNTI